ncbi:MAG: hypothetical protein ACR2IJ_07425 [Fluviibacter sp.]
MSSYYPEGGMMGSGIYSVEVEYEEFVCEDEDCGKTNEEGTTATDDWGTYIIECEFCGRTYRESSLSQDKDDYYQD